MIEPLDPTPYVMRAEEVGWGIGLIALTMGIHGFGMVWALRLDNAFKARIANRTTFLSGLINLIVASWLLVCVHIVEVIMWATFFQWKQCFPNFSTANYFALNEYTTVGSAFHLPDDWRLLEGMIATAGLLAFAWSTGVLLTLAREFQAQQLQRIDERRKHNGPPDAPAPPSGAGGAG